MSNPFGEDFCEYVHNPLMRQYQAMIRLLQSLRDSQSNCNDLECLTDNELLSNPNQSNQSLLSFYAPLMFAWVFFIFVAYLLRPRSYRTSNRKDLNDRDNDNNYNNDDNNGSPIS